MRTRKEKLINGIITLAGYTFVLCFIYNIGPPPVSSFAFLWEGGMMTNATVISASDVGDESFIGEVTYKYKAGGREFTKHETRDDLAYLVQKGKPTPYQVEIEYLPSNPAIINHTGEHWRLVLSLVTRAAFVVGVTFFAVNLAKNKTP